MKPITQSFGKSVATLARRYWIGLTAALLMTLVLLLGSPAWASPVASPANQTVPRPTATSSNDPIATATPLPNDGGDDSSNDNQSSDSGTGNQIIEQGDISGLLFGQAADEQPVDAPVYTAIISVATLNVREGPGTEFSVVGSVAGNQEVTVLFRNADNSWWYICCVTDTITQGWISSQLAEPNFDRAQSADLIPEFGVEETAAVVAAVAPSENAAETTTASTQVPAQAQLPLTLSISYTPDFVWQGQQVRIVLNVSNPNTIAVSDVEVSDELPVSLQLVGAEATSQGSVTQGSTVNGTVLVRIRWDSIPAGSAVSATIMARIAPDLPNGAVIDNLAAVRASNAAYSSSGVTIGMPPLGIPTFQ